MFRQSLKIILPMFAITAILFAVWFWYEYQKVCCAFPDVPGPEPVEVQVFERPNLGLMTSLPLNWPLGSDMQAIASGEVEPAWQKTALERLYQLEPLDTLSPIPGLSPDQPETDPLAGLDRLAIIQPRGLTPADNVALDNWVRGGGRLLLVLDPQLTGDYDLPLGDARRPVDTALIPPVVARWGLAVSFDPQQQPASRTVRLVEGSLLVELAGEISTVTGGDCAIGAASVVARCNVGEGRVTLFTDAAMFEGEENVEKHASIEDLIQIGLDSAPIGEFTGE